MYLVSLAQHSAWLGAAERPEKPSYSKRTARPQPRYMPACGAENGASYLSEGLSWSLLAMSPTVARRGAVRRVVARRRSHAGGINPQQFAAVEGGQPQRAEPQDRKSVV